METKTSKKSQLEMIGENSLFDNNISLIDKLNYVSGINAFNTFLNSTAQKSSKPIIHLVKHPRGLAIDLIINSKTVYFGLLFSEISKVTFSETIQITRFFKKNSAFEERLSKSQKSEIKLTITTIFGEILFSLKSTELFSVKDFFNKIKIPFESFQNEIDVTSESILERINLINSPEYQFKKASWRKIKFSNITLLILFGLLVSFLKLFSPNLHQPNTILPLILNFYISSWYIKNKIKQGKINKNPVIYGMFVITILFIIQCIGGYFIFPLLNY